MTKAALAAVVVAAAAFAAPGTAAPTARTVLTPRTHLFGAPVTAMLEVRGVHAAPVSVLTSFTPYRVVRREVTEHSDVVVYTFRLECLARECLPPVGGEREVVFPPVELHVGASTARLQWPAVRVASRLSSRDVASARLRAASEAPAPRYRVDPGFLGWSLAALAGLLALAAAVLVVRWWPQRTRTAPAQHGPTSLDYALTLVSVTAGAAEQERREALDSLAVVLEEHGLRRLARRARTLAWSRQAPAGDAARQLADEARASVGATR